MHPDWARAIRDQCLAAEVPFFFKQWGEWALVDDALRPGECSIGYRVRHIDGLPLIRLGKSRAGRLLDGREWNEMPVRPRETTT
jgi:protein gp37